MFCGVLSPFSASFAPDKGLIQRFVGGLSPPRVRYQQPFLWLCRELQLPTMSPGTSPAPCSSPHRSSRRCWEITAQVYFFPLFSLFVFPKLKENTKENLLFPFSHPQDLAGNDGWRTKMCQMPSQKGKKL